MSKKKASLEERALINQQREVSSQISYFYENGIIADISSSSGDDPFIKIFSTLRKDFVPQPLSDEQMIEKCSEIRKCVIKKEANNTEINFVKKVQKLNGISYELHYTLVKVMAMSAEKPMYLYLKKEDTLESIVFIGGNGGDAFLVTKGVDGDDCVVRLSEFYSLSISDNSQEGNEVGLITSYSWLLGKVFAGVIGGYSLDPVKSLLLSEWLKDTPNEQRHKEMTDLRRSKPEDE